MGYIRHDAIIVTSRDRKYLAPAYAKAKELELSVSKITDRVVNGYCSFLIAPDGSKEGWKDSDSCDDARKKWKEWAHQQRNDNELWIDWVHVSFAGDEAEDTKIVEHHKE